GVTSAPWLPHNSIQGEQAFMVEPVALPPNYPVVLGLGRPTAPGRFWAIPLLGFFVKSIILIPHWVILYVLFIVAGLAHLFIWAWVLFGGQYPDWGWVLTAGIVRWSARVTQYFYGFTDDYPAFSMEAPGDLQIARPPASGRFWAIPIIGFCVKGIILIPHFI